MPILLTDNFNRADTALNATAGNTDCGNGWIDYAGNTARILNNQLRISPSTPGGWQTKWVHQPSTGSPNGIKATLKANGGSSMNGGLVLFWNANGAANGNFYMGGWSGGALRIYLITGTWPTEIASVSFTPNFTQDYDCYFYKSGSSIILRWVNVVGGTYTEVTTTNSTYTSGRVGFTAWGDYNREEFWDNAQTASSGDLPVPSVPTVSGINQTGLNVSVPSTSVPSGVASASQVLSSGGPQVRNNSAATKVGATCAFGPVDLSAQKFVIFRWRFEGRSSLPNNAIERMENGAGLYVALMSSNTAYIEYLVDGYDSLYPSTAEFGAILEVGATGQNAYVNPVGSLNLATVNNFGLWWKQNSGENIIFNYRNVFYGVAVVAVGGSDVYPVNFQSFQSYINSQIGIINTFASTQAGYSNVRYLGLPTQIGDGSISTYAASSTVENINFILRSKTSTYTSSYKWSYSQVSDNFLGIRIKLKAGDICSYSNKSFYGADRWFFVVDATTPTTGLTILFRFCNFTNIGNHAFRAPEILESCSFIGCAELDLGSATFTASTISQALTTAITANTATIMSGGVISQSPVGVRVPAAGNYSNLGASISGNTVGVNISAGITGSINLSGLTFSENATDIQYEGVGAVTVTVSQSGLTTATPNGGTIVLQFPTVSYIRGVSGVPAGCAIAMFLRSQPKFANTSQYTLAAGNNSGNGTVVIQQSIPADTPNSGFIRLYDTATDTEQRYDYSSRTGSTFTLTGTLNRNYSTGAGAYVGYLDVLGSSAGTTSVSLPYVADRAVVLCVRIGSGSGKLQEFRVDLTLTNQDVTIPFSAIADTIN